MASKGTPTAFEKLETLPKRISPHRHQTLEEPQLAKAVGPAIREIAATRARQYQQLSARHRDGNIEAVKAQLTRIYVADGGQISDPELTEDADAIIAPDRVTGGLRHTYPTGGRFGPLLPKLRD